MLFIGVTRKFPGSRPAPTRTIGPALTFSAPIGGGSHYHTKMRGFFFSYAREQKHDSLPMG